MTKNNPSFKLYTVEAIAEGGCMLQRAKEYFKDWLESAGEFAVLHFPEVGEWMNLLKVLVLWLITIAIAGQIIQCKMAPQFHLKFPEVKPVVSVRECTPHERYRLEDRQGSILRVNRSFERAAPESRSQVAYTRTRLVQEYNSIAKGIVCQGLPRSYNEDGTPNN